MTAIPGKLTVGKDGKLSGPANLRFNSPFPCVNGTPGVTGKMQGVLMHTMVSDLPSCVASFNNPARQASANFGIAEDGEIWQFGPLGAGWEAWHAMAANRTWYGIEHADAGNPDNPLTQAQIVASAQLVECLSAFAGFPLQLANAPGERGYGTHFMGGAAFGGHTCPDLPPRHVRSQQRQVIIDLAKQIRAGQVKPFPSGRWTADGQTSLAQLCARQGCDVAAIWGETGFELTARHETLGDLQRKYLNHGGWTAAGPWTADIEKGTVLWLP